MIKHVTFFTILFILYTLVRRQRQHIAMRPWLRAFPKGIGV